MRHMKANKKRNHMMNRVGQERAHLAPMVLRRRLRRLESRAARPYGSHGFLTIREKVEMARLQRLCGSARY